MDEETFRNLRALVWTKFRAAIEGGLNLLQINDENDKTLKSTIAIIYDSNQQPALEEILLEVSRLSPTHGCRIFQCFAEHGITRSSTHVAMQKNEAFANQYKVFIQELPQLSEAETKELLKSHIEVTKNFRVPISQELLREFLDHLMQIDIKRMNVDDANVAGFVEMHQLMGELMFVLMNVRADTTLNFVQPFVMVFENLLMAISSFRSDRNVDVQLTSSEISIVADLAHKLEK